MYHGWPEYPTECPKTWNFREDLSFENGLVLKGYRLVIPSSLRPQMLQLIHQEDMGAAKGKRKESFFWPIVLRDITKLTTKCPTYMLFSKQQPKEELQPHSVPSFPWQKLGYDLYNYHGAPYLLVAEYYSKYPILRKLNSTLSTAIINHLKSIFAEYEIPESLVTDNAP